MKIYQNQAKNGAPRATADGLADGLNVEQAVRERYAAAAQASEAAVCCPVDYDPQYLAIIPDEILERDYGCGDPSKHVAPGETVLDLGSGGGKICYIAAQIVGAKGCVIGVDSNEEMLALARKHQSSIAQALGYANTDFRKGCIQDLALDLEDFDEYPVVGVDIGFVEGGEVPLSARAVGYESDAEVWQALAARSDVAVVDRFAVESGGFNIGDHPHFGISGIDPEADFFDGVRLQVRDEITGLSRQVEVIGVIELGASASFFGIFISADAFLVTFGEPFVSNHLVALENPGESQTIAREIEAALLTGGVQAESLKKLIDDDQALSRNFFLLMQGFMGLGLFVGIAAVGVIAFRTVVERRQQIGMLRAIGYKRSTVALSFMMESSFVTLLGISSGVGLAVWLSYFLLTSDEFPTSDAGYAIPWLQIGIFSGLTFLASLVMTYIPSRQAASVPIADALRYE